MAIANRTFCSSFDSIPSSQYVFVLYGSYLSERLGEVPETPPSSYSNNNMSSNSHTDL